MDQYNFYQYGDFGGSMATYTETGGPSMDGDGQYYEPMMINPSQMHQNSHLNYPQLVADQGGIYSGEESSFPGSQQFSNQYRNFSYGPFQGQNYGGQDVAGGGMMHPGQMGPDGFDLFDGDLVRNEELMRLPNEQLLHTSFIPELPRRDAAALIIEEQDRQGIHGADFGIRYPLNGGSLQQDILQPYQSGLDQPLEEMRNQYNRLSSSQGFHGMLGPDNQKDPYYHEETYIPKDVKSQKTIKATKNKKSKKTSIAMQNNYLPNGTGAIMEDSYNQPLLDPSQHPYPIGTAPFNNDAFPQPPHPLVSPSIRSQGLSLGGLNYNQQHLQQQELIDDLQDRQTFGSMGSSRAQSQGIKEHLSKRSLNNEEFSREQVHIKDNNHPQQSTTIPPNLNPIPNRKPPKPHIEPQTKLDYDQTTKQVTQSQMLSSRHPSAPQIVPKEIRVHGDSPSRQRMQLEIARQNSEKSRKSQQTDRAPNGKDRQSMVTSKTVQIEEKPVISEEIAQKTHVSISETQPITQQQQSLDSQRQEPNQIDNFQIGNQLSQNETIQKQGSQNNHKTDSQEQLKESPEFQENADLYVTGPIQNPFEDNEDIKLNLQQNSTSEEQVAKDKFNQVGQCSFEIEECREQKQLVSNINHEEDDERPSPISLTLVADANDPEVSQRDKVAQDYVNQLGVNIAAGQQKQKNHQSALVSSKSETVPQTENVDNNEVPRHQIQRKVMIKQPSSGETASQFHDNESPWGVEFKNNGQQRDSLRSYHGLKTNEAQKPENCSLSPPNQPNYQQARDNIQRLPLQQMSQQDGCQNVEQINRRQGSQRQPDIKKDGIVLEDNRTAFSNQQCQPNQNKPPKPDFVNYDQHIEPHFSTQNDPKVEESISPMQENVHFTARSKHSGTGTGKQQAKAELTYQNQASASQFHPQTYDFSATTEKLQHTKIIDVPPENADFEGVQMEQSQDQHQPEMPTERTQNTGHYTSLERHQKSQSQIQQQLENEELHLDDTNASNIQTERQRVGCHFQTGHQTTLLIEDQKYYQYQQLQLEQQFNQQEFMQLNQQELKPQDTFEQVLLPYSLDQNQLYSKAEDQLEAVQNDRLKREVMDRLLREEQQIINNEGIQDSMNNQGTFDDNIRIEQTNYQAHFNQDQSQKPIDPANLLANHQLNQIISQNQSVPVQSQPTELDYIFQQFQNSDKYEFVDRNPEFDQYFQDGCTSVINSFFIDEVYQNNNQIQLHRNDMQQSNDLFNQKFQRAEQRSINKFGGDWRDGLENKYYKFRELNKQGGLSECSSSGCMISQSQGEVMPFDLQYILYDFDFENKSTFQMQSQIGQRNWQDIYHNQQMLSQIESNDLILNKVLKDKNTTQTALNQFNFDRNKRNGIEILQLQTQYQDHQPSTNLHQNQCLVNDTQNKYPQKHKSSMQINFKSMYEDNQLKYSNQYNNTAQKSNRRNFGDFNKNLNEIQVLKVPDKLATQNKKHRKSMRVQSLQERKTLFKQSMQQSGKDKYLQTKAHQGRSLFHSKTLMQHRITKDKVLARNLKRAKRSKSPQPFMLSFETQKLLEKPLLRRYMSPQQLKRQKTARLANGLKGSGDKKTKNSNVQLQPQQQKVEDIQGQINSHQLLEQKQDVLRENNNDEKRFDRGLEGVHSQCQQTDVQLRLLNDHTDAANLPAKIFGTDMMIVEGDEEFEQENSFEAQDFDGITLEQDEEYYYEDQDEESEVDPDMAKLKRGSGLFGSASEHNEHDHHLYGEQTDYNKFMDDMRVKSNQQSTYNQNNQERDNNVSLLHTNELLTDRFNIEDNQECIISKLEFFIEDLSTFLKKELDFIMRKEFKTVKPEQIRINQKIVYRIDNEAIFTTILNENNQLIQYLCQHRRHFIHLKREHQNRLDQIVFEQNCFVFLLKSSKQIRIDTNNISDTASQITRTKMKNLNTLQKRMSSDLNKSLKKPILFKNKVEKFLHDYSIQKQDVLDIEKLLPFVHSQATISNSSPQSRQLPMSTMKFDIASTGCFSQKLQSMDPRWQTANLANASSTLLNQQLQTIQEDDVEVQQLQFVEETTEEQLPEFSKMGLSISKIESANLKQLKDQLSVDEFYDFGLLQISKVFDLQSIMTNQQNKKFFLQNKYIAVFHYFTEYTTSLLFNNLQQNCIYFKIDQILRRVPPKYFDYIKKNNLDRWHMHTERVQMQSTSRTDNKLSIFDAGFPNLQYQFSQDYTLDVYIRRLMYQSRPIMDQIKQMIFQSKQCVLIQNLIPEYFKNLRPQKNKGLDLKLGGGKTGSLLSSVSKKDANKGIDPREDFILSKFNELYYLSCQKDDTYRFNIRQGQFSNGIGSTDFMNKKSTFYEDQPLEQSSDESDDITSYMIDTFVQKAVTQDEDNLKNFQEKYQNIYSEFSNYRKLRGNIGAAGKMVNQRRYKKLKDKLRINLGLQVVKFCDEQLQDDEDDNIIKNAVKIGQEQPVWPIAGLGQLTNNPKFLKQEDKKEDDVDRILNVPRRVIPRQEAKEKDKLNKETYPKFKLSLQFGYGQFISSDNLFEVYDTKLKSQAQEDDAKREKKKKKKEDDKFEKREALQQAILNNLRDNFRSTGNQFSDGVKHKPLKMDRKRFEYRTADQGLDGQKIYIVTPKNLLDPIQHNINHAPIEKFVKVVQRSHSFNHCKPTLSHAIKSVTHQPLICNTNDSKPLDLISQPKGVIEGKSVQQTLKSPLVSVQMVESDGLQDSRVQSTDVIIQKKQDISPVVVLGTDKVVTTVNQQQEQNDLQQTNHGNEVSSLDYRHKLIKYQNQPRDLHHFAIQRLNSYQKHYKQLYDSNPLSVQAAIYLVDFENISEKDSILEINSDEEPEAFDTDRTKKSLETIDKQSLPMNLTLQGRGRTMSVNVKRPPAQKQSQMSPQKLMDTSMNTSKHRSSVHLSSMQTFTFRQQLMGRVTQKNTILGLKRRASFIERRPSLNGSIENNQGPQEQLLNSQNIEGDNRSQANSSEIISAQKNLSFDFFEVESNCDIEARPETCRVRLEHLKHVHLSLMQKSNQVVESVRIFIDQIIEEHQEDQQMNDRLKMQIIKIKQKKQTLNERKEKVIRDYQMQESSSHMQLIGVSLNRGEMTFKPIEFQQCMRIHPDPIQIIKIVDNKPYLYRQKDIFTPIISRIIQTQEHYVFRYNFQEMNEPKFKAIKQTQNSEKWKKSVGSETIHYETFIYQDEMSPAIMDLEKSEEQSNTSKMLQDNVFIDKFDQISSDRSNSDVDEMISTDEDFDLPVLVRFENAKNRKKLRKEQKLKQQQMLPNATIDSSTLRPASSLTRQYKPKNKQLDTKTSSKSNLKFANTASLQTKYSARNNSESVRQKQTHLFQEGSLQACAILDKKDPYLPVHLSLTAKHNNLLNQNIAAADTISQVTMDSARRKKNLKNLKVGLKQQQQLIEQRLKKHQQLKFILTNKPVNFFNPDAGNKLQEDIEKMNKQTISECHNNFVQPEYVPESGPKPQNLPLKNLVHTVSKVMQSNDHKQLQNNKDEGILEAVSHKLRRAIEVNQPQVIQDFVLYNGRAIDMYDKDGFTLLCRAVHYGRSDIVELLLKAGADPSKPCRESEDTPLHIAVNFNFKKVQDLLLDHNANEKKLNKKGLLPWQGIVHQNQNYQP